MLRTAWMIRRLIDISFDSWKEQQQWTSTMIAIHRKPDDGTRWTRTAAVGAGLLCPFTNHDDGGMGLINDSSARLLVCAGRI